ncbi:hypothetical protein E2C01_029731 [Portunus trituberculatus]|uniref:Uncharacterized protein n=1 Tax=Portunus trituberculatus TaxID=210409 RepID=A0A5B7ESR2_PORTR|nr:hypothetical protein [Portunus trituberculatus]
MLWCDVVVIAVWYVWYSTPHHTTSNHTTCHSTPYDTTPHAMPCHTTPHAMPCHATCHATPHRYTTPHTTCHATPSHIWCGVVGCVWHVVWCGVVCCGMACGVVQSGMHFYLSTTSNTHFSWICELVSQQQNCQCWELLG